MELIEVINIIISIIVSGTLFVIAKIFLKRKFHALQGHQKLLGIVIIVIILGEIVFLSVMFGLFDFALEIITSVGVGMVILGISLQHQLKNIVAGIGLFFNNEVNVGDIITIKEERGTVIELHLTHTVALDESGERIIIPNQKFAEDVIRVQHKKRQRIDF